MLLNLQFPADLVTFTEEILIGKLHFCAVNCNEFRFYDWSFSVTVFPWVSLDQIFIFSINTEARKVSIATSIAVIKYDDQALVHEFNKFQQLEIFL